MNKLINLDFKRFFKDKLFLVVCILAVGFAVLTPFLYVVIFGNMEDLDPITKEMLAGYVTAKGQFFSAFSFGNNLGLIAPLLIGIILFKDFSFGTIRNKIIAGYSRPSIFLSNFMVCFITTFGIVLAHAFLTLGICLFFFDYQTTPFTSSDFWYFWESLLFQMLVYMFVSTFVSYLCTTKKNMGIMIVLYIAVVFGCSMIAGVLQIVLITIGTQPDMKTTVEIIEFVQRINVFNSSATIGLGTSYKLEDVCYYVITPIVGTIGLMGFGAWRFSKIDLK